MTAQLADQSSARRSAVADVDVVIVGYHSRDLVTACLDSLADDAELVSMTMTVVDNGSADGTVEAVAGRGDGADVLDMGRNPGFATANNRGIAPGLRPATCWCSIPTPSSPPGQYATLVDFADAHPAAGVVAPRLLELRRVASS